MRISLSWILRLLHRDRLPVTVEQLQQLLTLRVAEIESDLERIGPSLDGVVVAKVLTVDPHPNADRLRVVTVEGAAGRILPIVCGAPNLAVGQHVALATVGTRLSKTAADGVVSELVIKAAKLRGAPSEGMICSAAELGLGPDHDGILVLDPATRPGTPLADIMGGGDTVFVIDNHGLSHRPDLWGHWGWAREVAAILDLTPPDDPDIHTAAGPGTWSVSLDDPGCTTYAGAVVEGLSGETPSWMRSLLEAAGVRPLGLAVDITNVVMLELGEPMHAFDGAQVHGERIIVRGGRPGEVLRTLDGREQRLVSTDIVIADAQGPLALAGIMGGAASAVTASTSKVIFEAAIFRPERIRRTRIRTGTASDSSARFEKGLYAELASAGLNRALALVAENCPASRVVARFLAGDPGGQQSRIIPYDPARLTAVVGIRIPPQRQTADLGRLGFPVGATGVVVPWWRTKDIHADVDLIEEIIRLEGLERIEPEVPRLPAAAPARNLLRQAEHAARQRLSALGWDEVQTYGFSTDAWAERLGWEAGRLIRLINPLSQEQTVLRMDLLPNLCEAVGRNRKHLPRVAIHEIGKRYGVGIGIGPTPDEELVVSGAYADRQDEAPFYAARDAALGVIGTLGLEARWVLPTDDDPLVAHLQKGRRLLLQVADHVVGICGEVIRAIGHAAHCPERLAMFTVRLELIARRLGPAKPAHYHQPSRFPVVEREFSWVCPEALLFGDLKAAVERSAGDLCGAVDLVTIYRGDPIPAGSKSISLRLLLQAPDRTLEEKEVTALCGRIVQAVEHRLVGCHLRT